MTTTKTASERGRSNRRRGQEAQRAVARYLRTVGFPGADSAPRVRYRRTDNGDQHDPFDITGIPGLVISVKNDASNAISKWLGEVELGCNNLGGDFALLVVRRKGKAQPAQWWAWYSLPALNRLLTGVGGRHTFSGTACMELAELVPNLRRAGYGDPLPEPEIQQQPQEITA